MSPSHQQTVVINQAPSTSGLAMAGLVFSTLGWLTCGLLCIPGTALCFLALFSRGPKGAAIAGLIVGFPGSLFFAFMGLGLIMSISGIGAAVDEARLANTESQSQVTTQQPLGTRGQVDHDQPEKLQVQATQQSLDKLENVPIAGFSDYSVEIKRSNGVTVCQVTFNKIPPTSSIGDEVLRNVVRELVKRNGDREILASAFDASGKAIPGVRFGGSLSYMPGDRKIRTAGEREGLRTTEVDEGEYFVRVEERKTAIRRWFNAHLVFAKEPTDTEVKSAVLREIDKLKTEEVDIHSYIYQGDKSDRLTWGQVRTYDWKDVLVVDYVAATGEISPALDGDSYTVVVDESKRESRTWTDTTGQFSIEAVFVSCTNDQVKIKRDDNGKAITIPLDKLSESSKQYIESLRK